MNGSAETCLELLEIIEQQAEVITKKDKVIRKLINENIEQENLIEVMMREELS
jgi:hypothetical protein